MTPSADPTQLTEHPTDDLGDDLGLIDFLVMELPADWTGGGFEPLLALVEQDAIRLLDVEVLVRAEDGSTRFEEPGHGAAADLSGLAVFAGSSSGLLDDDDAAEVGELIDPANTGLVIVYENVWTATLAASLRGRGGRIAALGQIGAAELDDALG